MSTEIAKQSSEEPKTLADMFNSPAIKRKIAEALPKHLSADRMLRVFGVQLRKNPKLQKCTPVSLVNCLTECSSLGLEPDGRRCYLIPFENKREKTVTCTLIVGYQGLAELVLRSGLISTIHADVICENDDFEWNLGEITRHRIDWRRPRGEPYAAYAIAKTKDGGCFTQVMTKDEIYAIRDGSQGWKAFLTAKEKGWNTDSPWDPANPSAEKEMWKKTPFRRLSKWLPLSAEFRDSIAREEEYEQRAAEPRPVQGVTFELPENPLDAPPPSEQAPAESSKPEIDPEEAEFFKQGVEQ